LSLLAVKLEKFNTYYTEGQTKKEADKVSASGNINKFKFMQ